jgi:hypothetical protein
MILKLRRTFEFVVLTYREMMQIVLRYTHRMRPIISLPWSFGKMQGWALEKLPENILTLTRDQVRDSFLLDLVWVRRCRVIIHMLSWFRFVSTLNYYHSSDPHSDTVFLSSILDRWSSSRWTISPFQTHS